MKIRYFVYIILFLILSFILNITLYFFSDTYRNFLKSLKSEKQDIKQNINKVEKNETNFVKKKKVVKSKSENDKKDNIKVEYKEKVLDISETKIEKEILKKFREYSLKKLELHPRLFDLTSEYPDDYIEYYSEYLTIYFFWNKPYSDIKDIFNVLSYELPFSINEVNNFWDKSFYINLKDEFKDDNIRFVFTYKTRTIGIKVNKKFYDMVKIKLQNLKK